MKLLVYGSLTAALFAAATVVLTSHAEVPPADAPKEDTNLTTIPPGYRDWKLISVAREEGSLQDIRAVLGNDIAIKAYREGTQPFPDGAVIARIAWNLVPSEDNNKAFGKEQSFVAGAPKNGVQFMFKDSKKYAASGGWGYAQFSETDGKPASEEMLRTCFPCHEAIKSRDFVFTQYSLAGLAGQK
jgi:hypothetical protein